jgi:hypothetical protein
MYILLLDYGGGGYGRITPYVLKSSTFGAVTYANSWFRITPDFNKKRPWLTRGE